MLPQLAVTLLKKALIRKFKKSCIQSLNRLEKKKSDLGATYCYLLVVGQPHLQSKKTGVESKIFIGRRESFDLPDC